MVPVVSIVGRKNNGKTTLIEGVVKELKSRGYRVGTIKHSLHHDLQPKNVDREGKDTYRHYNAGAEAVVLVGEKILALFKGRKESVDQIISSYLSSLDIILIEGFKEGDKPKIEVLRKELGEELLCVCSKDNLIALVSDKKFELNIPCFGLDNYIQIADFLEEKFIQKDSHKKIGLFVDGKEIKLKGFPARFIEETILGMIGSLRGIPENPLEIKIEIRK